jgi:glucosyl-dolichyl phosphate glucuronosyltransferase
MSRETGRAPGRPDGRQAARAARPEVSVIICAYTERRWNDTLAAVASVAAQSRPARETIVVVDYNPSLYERLKAELPDVTVVRNNEAPGLSGGKNTGIATAVGEIVAFLDDDAVASADWLKFLVDSYTGADVMGVGGQTLPLWETSRPSWFPGEFDWVVGCTYIGMSASPAPVRNLLGGNASFRREAFAKAGGFRSGIGRSGRGLPAGGEETEFCIRLRQRSPSSTLLFDNRAVIWHRVPDVRSTFSYFLTRCYAEGLSKALVTSNVGRAEGLSAERAHALRALPAGVRRGLAEAVHGDESGLGRAAAIVAGLAAAVAGYGVGSARSAVRRLPRAGTRRAQESRGDR